MARRNLEPQRAGVVIFVAVVVGMLCAAVLAGCGSSGGHVSSTGTTGPTGSTGSTGSTGRTPSTRSTASTGTVAVTISAPGTSHPALPSKHTATVRLTRTSTVPKPLPQPKAIPVSPASGGALVPSRTSSTSQVPSPTATAAHTTAQTAPALPGTLSRAFVSSVSKVCHRLGSAFPKLEAAPLNATALQAYSRSAATVAQRMVASLSAVKVPAADAGALQQLTSDYSSLALIYGQPFSGSTAAHLALFSHAQATLTRVADRLDVPACAP